MAIGVFAWGLLDAPSETASPPNNKDLIAAQKKSLLKKKMESELPSLKEFEKVMDRNIRQSLYDPPPAVDKKVVHKKRVNVTSPPFKLLGTMIEEGHSAAIFSVPQQGLVVCRVGEIIGPKGKTATIEKIGPDSVKVRINDRVFLIKLEDKKQRGKRG